MVALRWLVRIAAGTILVAVLAALSFGIALETPWGREVVRERIEDALAASYPGSHVRAVEGSPFGTFVVRDVAIGGTTGRPELSIGRLEVEISLRSLFVKRVRVDRLELEDVVVVASTHLAQPREPEPPDGTLPGKPSGSSWSFELRDLHVRGLSIVHPGGEIELRDGSLAASVAVEAGGPITAAVCARGEWRGRAATALAFARKLGDTIELPLFAATLDATAPPFGGAPGGPPAVGSVLAIGMRGPASADPAALPAPLGKAPIAALGGVASVHAPAALVREFAHVRLPADLSVSLATRDRDHIDVHVADGAATADASLQVDAAVLRGRGLVTASVPDVGAYTRGKLAGRGIVVAALEGDRDHVRGLVSAKGERDGYHAVALVAVDASRSGAWTAAQVASDFGPTRATAAATLARKGDAFVLAKGTLTGRAVHARFGARAHAWLLDANLTATGRVWPEPDLQGGGALELEGAEADDVAAEVLHVALDHVHATRAGADARVRAEVAGLSRGTRPLGAGELAARLAVDADGSVDAHLGFHRVVIPAGGTWSGAGGHVTVSSATIAIEDLRTGDGSGKVTASGKLDRASGDLTAALTASDVALTALAPGLGGAASGRANVERHADRWDATASFDARGVVARGRDVPPLAGGGACPAGSTPEWTCGPIAGHGKVIVHGREIGVDLTASVAERGVVRVRGEVEGPSDLADARAWRRADRRALRGLEIALEGVRVDVPGRATGGAIDGTLQLHRDRASGTLQLRGLHTRGGDVEADLTLGAGERDRIAATLAMRLVGIAAVDGRAQLALAAHPFDPDGWIGLGRDVLAGAHLQAQPIAFTPATFERLGVIAPYRGTVDVSADIATGARSLTAHAGIHGVQGGVFVRPLEVEADVGADATGVDATGAVHASDQQVVAWSAHLPGALTLESWRARPVIGTVALAALPALPDQNAPPASLAARDLLAIFGRDDVSDGKIGGAITLGGTLGAPTADASFGATDVAIRASVEGRPPARLANLGLNARWSHERGLDVGVEAREPGDSWLRVKAHGQPDQPRTLAGTFDAHGFDIAPLSAFAPGPLAAARGVLDASLGLDGFDADTGKLRGTLHVSHARVPLHDRIGTLRDGDLELDVADHTIDGKFSGKLGRGTIDGRGTLELAGSTPHKLDAKLALHAISLIQSHQPVIDADVTAHLEYGQPWSGDVEIAHGHVVVPAAAGHALLEAKTPSDMVFVDAPPAKATPLLHRPPPARPWLMTRVVLRDTRIELQDERVQASGRASGKLFVAVGGESIGVDGMISAERGDLQLFGQRSDLERGDVTFDGTLDPLLDISVQRDLDSITVTANVSGRASKPQITFEADSGSYSQGDLLAMFVGGQPSDDRGGGEAGQAGATLAAGYFSEMVAKRLERLLPIRLQYGYLPATAVASDAVRASHWSGDDLYFEYREHPAARPDENPHELLIEYHLGGNWLLRGMAGGSTDTTGTGEIQHRWRW
jgi:autotransporter translocation and assembly factor TamB